MAMSATQLGEHFGRSARAMNVLLHEHGFLQGGPGAWSPTDLGEGFASWVDKDNGYGGIAYRSWSWLTWDDGVIDALKASIKAHPDGLPTEVFASAPGLSTAAQAAGSNARHALGPFPLSRGSIAGAVAGGALVVSLPVLRRAWSEHGQPALARMRARRGPQRADATANDPSSHDDEAGPSPT